MSSSLLSYRRTLSNAQVETITGKTHIPNLAVRVMLSLRSTIAEYSHPTRVEEDRWGFPILHHASLLRGQNGLVKRHIVAVAAVDSYVCGTDMRGDEVDIAEAALDDLDAQGADGLDVRGVPHKRDDLEVREGLDEVSAHCA